MWRFFRHNILLIMITLIFVAIGGYYFVRHLKPFTQNAFMVANTRPVSVLVEGYITDVHVENNQFVRKGDALFTIFQSPYSLKVDGLTHAIAAKKAEVKSLNAKLEVIAANIAARKAVLENDVYLAGRADEMYSAEAVSQAYAEERGQSSRKSGAELLATQNEELVIQAQIEVTEAQMRQLASELELAKIYLSETVITALSDGYIVNMFIAPGGYYYPGDVLCAFVEADSFRVQANFEETDLADVYEGQPATVWLWQYPGKKFRGVVEHINWGAERRKTDATTGVAIVEKENQWFLLPQRFPVQIKIIDSDAAYPFHLAGSAYVELDGSSRLAEQIIWRIFQW